MQTHEILVLHSLQIAVGLLPCLFASNLKHFQTTLVLVSLSTKNLLQKLYIYNLIQSAYHNSIRVEEQHRQLLLVCEQDGVGLWGIWRVRESCSDCALNVTEPIPMFFKNASITSNPKNQMEHSEKPLSLNRKIRVFIMKETGKFVP